MRDSPTLIEYFGIQIGQKPDVALSNQSNVRFFCLRLGLIQSRQRRPTLYAERESLGFDCIQRPDAESVEQNHSNNCCSLSANDFLSTAFLAILALRIMLVIFDDSKKNAYFE
jgi:hypothetical protein